MNPMADTPSGFLAQSEYQSMTGSFYPSGHVFAMLPSQEAAQFAAAELQGVGATDVRVATPPEIESSFGSMAEAILDTPPSVGREGQFTVRFLELARAGQHGVLARCADSLRERACAVLQRHGASVAYRYGALVIEEWVSPSRKAERAAPYPM